MENYSDVVAATRAVFIDAKTRGIKTEDDVLALWAQSVVLCQRFAMGSTVRGLRFEQVDFDTAMWKAMTQLLASFVKAGCIDRRNGDRRLAGALVLMAEVATEKVLTEVVRPKREYKKKTPAVVTPEKIIQTVYQKPPRKEVADSIAVIVDLANVTKRCGKEGRYVLPANRINWSAFMECLRTYHGNALPVERAVLCVSEHYFAENQFALRSAERYGFRVSKKNGQKEGDPVVVCELLDAVLRPLLADHARIPVISLVSGDMDFSGIIDTLRTHLRVAGLDLRLRVTSWDEGLSYQLDRCAFDRSSLDTLRHKIRA